MGGLLALDLATKNLRLSNWSHDFKSFCLQIFDRPRLFSGLPILSKIFPVRYKTKPLEMQVKQYCGRDRVFGWTQRQVIPPVRVAVVSSSTTGTPYVIANY